MENYLTIDEINSNAIYAPIGEEQAFNRRIITDEIKQKRSKEKWNIKYYLNNVETKPNFYQQFNFAGQIPKNYHMYSHEWGEFVAKPKDQITLKDYKKMFRELKIKAPKGANKEWYIKTWIKSFYN